MADKRVTYTGEGFFIGLPARDMTLQEWREYPKELTDAAIKAGIFKVITVITSNDNEVKQWD